MAFPHTRLHSPATRSGYKGRRRVTFYRWQYFNYYIIYSPHDLRCLGEIASRKFGKRNLIVVVVATFFPLRSFNQKYSENLFLFLKAISLALAFLWTKECHKNDSNIFFSGCFFLTMSGFVDLSFTVKTFFVLFLRRKFIEIIFSFYLWNWFFFSRSFRVLFQLFSSFQHNLPPWNIFSRNQPKSLTESRKKIISTVRNKCCWFNREKKLSQSLLASPSSS